MIYKYVLSFHEEVGLYRNPINKKREEWVQTWWLVMKLLHKPDEELLDANQDMLNSIDQSILHETT